MKSPFEPRSLLYRLLTNPLLVLAQCIYEVHLSYQKIQIPRRPIRVACISDTHAFDASDRLPSADILIHAGDLTNSGSADEIQIALNWLKNVPGYQYKIVVAGNHDSFFDPSSRHPGDADKTIDFGDVLYLCQNSVELHFPHLDRRINVYGAPQIPACGGSKFAFQYPREHDAWKGTIPADTDILVTHTPPRWHLDLAHGMGCSWLLADCWRVRPLLHVFGHLHWGYGQQRIHWDNVQASYERLCSRMSVANSIWDLVDLARLTMESLRERNQCAATVMVNAAAMVGSTGKLGNAPQVVLI